MATIPAYWNSGNGSWFSAIDWNEPNPNSPPQFLNYVPGSNNDVNVSGTGGTTAPLTISYSGTDSVATLSSTGNSIIAMTGGSLTVLGSSEFDEIDVGGGTTLNVASGATFTLINGTFIGTIAGAGTFREVSGLFTIDAGFAITAAIWLLDYQTGANTTSTTLLNTDLGYAGNFILQSPFGDAPTLELNSHVLTLSGTSSLSGIIDGPGTLKVTGTAMLGGATIGYDPTAGYAAGNAATFENAGAVSQSGFVNLSGTILNDAGHSWSFIAASTISIAGIAGTTFTNNGTLSDTASGAAVEIDGTFVNDSSVTIASGATLTLASGIDVVGGFVSGAGTLTLGTSHNATLGNGLTVAGLTVTGGGMLSLGGNVAYAGQFDFTDQFGYLNTSGDTLTLSGAAVFTSGAVYGPGSVKLTGTASIGYTTFGYGPSGGSTTANAATLENAGAVSQIAGIGLNGTILNDVGGTWTFATASAISNNNAASFDNSGTLADTGAGGSEIDGTFGNLGTVSIAAGATLTFAAGMEVLAGTVSGAGTLNFGYAHIATLVPSALTVAAITVNGGNGGGNLMLAEDVGYAGSFSFTDGFGYLTLGGHTLTLSGISVFSGGSTTGGTVRITGTATVNGTLGYDSAKGYAASAATTFENAGAVTQVAGIALNGTILNDAGHVWTIAGGTVTNQGTSSFDNSGTLAITASSSEFDGTFGNLGTVSIAAGSTFTLAAGSAVLAGTVSGAGTLAFGYAHVATLVTSVLNVAAITVNGGNGGGTLRLAEDIAYAGSFSFTDGFGFLSLGGHTLTLSGASTFSGGSTTGGTVRITGSATVAGTLGYDSVNAYARSAAATFENAGAVLQVGNMTVNGTILNDAGHVWTITSGTISDQGATFANNGTLGVAAGVQSEIDGIFANKGAVAIGAGSSLSLYGTLTNDGVMVAGGQLVVRSALAADAGMVGGTTIDAGSSAEFQGSVAANQSVSFAANTGTLRIDQLSSFGAAVGGYRRGDLIDLAGATVTGVRYTYAGGGGGTLAVFNGSTLLGTVALAGDYANDGFTIQSDGNGGTNVRVDAPADFTGSGSSDVLVQNSNGATVAYTTNGLAVTNAVLLAAPGPTWHLVSTADFNGDGQADLLYQNDNGTLVDYLMNGTSIAAGYNLGNPGSSWHVRGTADFNGDDKADVLLQNDNGALVILETNGASLVGSALVGTLPAGAAVEGIGDFNGDGQPDILVQTSAGALIDFTMSGTGIASGAVIGTPGAGYSVGGTGDYNGDGRADILLHNDNGVDVVWEMNGPVATGAVFVGNPGPGYMTSVAGLDLNGDGNADLVLQNSLTSTLVGYTLNNTAAITAGAVLGTPGAGWSVVGSNPTSFLDGTGANLNLAATPGPDQFVLTSTQAGIHTLTGFDPAQDSVALSLAVFPSYAAVQANEVAYQGGTFVNFSASSALVIQGVAPGQLTAANFVLR